MRLTSLIEDMERFAKEKNVPIMQKEGINYLKEYVNTNKINDILEIGTAIGYSTIILRSCSRSITSIERDEERYNIALKNVSLSKLDNITLINIDALEANITGEYDMIFIDAAKGKYPFFLSEALRMLAPNGTIFADNILYKGYVMSDYNKHKQRTAVRNLREYIAETTENPSLDTQILEVGDGLAITKLKGKDL